MEEESAFDVNVWQPPFLENSLEEISNHKKQSKKSLKYLLDQYETFVTCISNILALEKSYCRRPTEYARYETQLKTLQREYDADERKACKLDRTIKSFELGSQRSQVEQIQDEILQLSEDTDKLALEEDKLIKHRKKATESMRLLWNTYISAKGTYKTHLLCHIRVHEPAENKTETSNTEIAITVTFSQAKDDSQLLQVKLSIENSMWRMLDMQPYVPAAVEAQRKLHETNDIRDFLCHLREEAVRLFKK